MPAGRKGMFFILLMLRGCYLNVNNIGSKNDNKGVLLKPYIENIFCLNDLCDLAWVKNE